MDYKLCNRKILDLYFEWSKEVPKQLMTSGYSNIFCTGIPADWFQARNRILIVGEETTWPSRDKFTAEYPTIEIELEKCQEWIINNLNDGLNGKTNMSSSFWHTVRRIDSEIENSSIAWTNIDVINTAKELAKSSNTQLSQNDRKLLHSTKTKLLQGVIDIIQPDIIVFIGWHDVSLKHELFDVYNSVYPNDKSTDKSVIKSNDYIVVSIYNDTPCVLTYHPGWPKANSQNYKDRLIKTIKENLYNIL